MNEYSDFCNKNLKPASNIYLLKNKNTIKSMGTPDNSKHE